MSYCGDNQGPGFGDVNQDGEVNIIDVMGLVNSITGMAEGWTPPPSQMQELMQHADVNNDGYLNIHDVVIIINQIFGQNTPMSMQVTQQVQNLIGGAQPISRPRPGRPRPRGGRPGRGRSRGRRTGRGRTINEGDRRARSNHPARRGRNKLRG